MPDSISMEQRICDGCNTQYDITKNAIRIRNRYDIPNYCPSCMKEYKKKSMQNTYNNKPEEWKRKFSEKQRKRELNRSPEEKAELGKRRGEARKRNWQQVNEERKKRLLEPMQRAARERIENMTPEQRKSLAKQWTKFKTDEEIEKVYQASGRRLVEYNRNKSKEEKQYQIDYMQVVNEVKKEEISTYSKLKFYDIESTIPKGETHSKKKNRKLEKVELTNLEARFEREFNNHPISETFYFKQQIRMYHKIPHKWKYGIYLKDNKELKVLIDFEYDISDDFYNEDEKRSLSIPISCDVIPCILTQDHFYKSFDRLIKFLNMTYDEYVDYIFNIYKQMPFPNPKYTDRMIFNSINDLIKLDVSKLDPSCKNTSGDRVIHHFHESIYAANRKGRMSPFDLWYNDTLLKRSIKHRILYHTELKKNLILNGFSFSRVAPKVQILSAPRAKVLINKYLNDCSQIFDPFSSFSSRMLATISLGKQYIGQDVSLTHTNESNRMIKFLKRFGKKYGLSIDIIDAIVEQQDVLHSSGEYECLFTCVPYQDSEQYYDVSMVNKTCDEWIDECLDRFDCIKYLFIVNNTEKYKDNIVDEITTKIFTDDRNGRITAYRTEYVILIEN